LLLTAIAFTLLAQPQPRVFREHFTGPSACGQRGKIAGADYHAVTRSGIALRDAAGNYAGDQLAPNDAWDLGSSSEEVEAGRNALACCDNQPPGQNGCDGPVMCSVRVGTAGFGAVAVSERYEFLGFKMPRKIGVYCGAATEEEASRLALTACGMDSCRIEASWYDNRCYFGGTVPQGNQCVCPQGTMRDRNSLDCMVPSQGLADDQQVLPPSPCPPGLIFNNNPDDPRCECPGGGWFDRATMNCVQNTCSGGSHFDAKLKRCTCDPGFSWSVKSRVCKSVGCTGGRYLDPTTDACTCPPSAPNWSHSRAACMACPATQVFINDSCQCPAGYNWNGQQCVTCTGGGVWNGAGCVCPYGTAWTGSRCADPATQAQQQWSGAPGGCANCEGDPEVARFERACAYEKSCCGNANGSVCDCSMQLTMQCYLDHGCSYKGMSSQQMQDAINNIARSVANLRAGATCHQIHETSNRTPF
jgi:hypothetical protein